MSKGSLREWIEENMIDPEANHPCYVWALESAEEIYRGTMDKIPEDILDMEFSSLEYAYENGLCFNINDEECKEW